MTTQTEQRGRVLLERYGPRAMITGAAVGMGAAFARALAEAGFDLLLVDIDGEALARRASELAALGRDVRTQVLDLRRPDILDCLGSELERGPVGLLINNAARGVVEPFFQRSLEEHLEDLALNARAPLVLSHHLGAKMQAQGRGAILFVSSASALVGTPYVAHYAATKAYDLALGEGLHAELEGTEVDVLSVVLGQVRTPGWENEGALPALGVSVMEPTAVAEEALDALLQRRGSRIIGRANRAAYHILCRLLPRRLASRMVGSTMRRIFAHKL